MLAQATPASPFDVTSAQEIESCRFFSFRHRDVPTSLRLYALDELARETVLNAPQLPAILEVGK
jgi:hypothetical protein